MKLNAMQRRNAFDARNFNSFAQHIQKQQQQQSQQS